MSKELATDLELALFYKQHIENPCGIPGTDLNLRDFYIRQARRDLEHFKDDLAKRFLSQIISIYE